jgi:hypothetical protein
LHFDFRGDTEFLSAFVHRGPGKNLVGWFVGEGRRRNSSEYMSGALGAALPK